MIVPVFEIYFQKKKLKVFTVNEEKNGILNSLKINSNYFKGFFSKKKN